MPARSACGGPTKGGRKTVPRPTLDPTAHHSSCLVYRYLLSSTSKPRGVSLATIVQRRQCLPATLDDAVKGSAQCKKSSTHFLRSLVGPFVLYLKDYHSPRDIKLRASL